VTTDLEGNVYIVDQKNYRIQKFMNDGTYILKWGSSGSGPGQFNNPRGIAVDADGNIFVADSDNRRIQKFSPATPVEGTTWGRLKTMYP
jgi:DNA-binding beta-propeller fold protein YncE